jgi:ABC-type dipeptide/oligopeptide/nickel transport system permease component
MLIYFLRRAASTIGTLWLAFTAVFCALRALPGDVIREQLALSGASDAQIAERRAQLGLDQPLVVQYMNALLGVLHGDLGVSIGAGRSVNDILGEQIAPTLTLGLGALVIAITVGITLGLAGASDNRIVKAAVTGLISLILASPVYWVGTIGIFIFSLGLHWLPSAGSGDLRSLILPWTTLGLSLSGGIARVTLSSVNATHSAEFIRTARAKGLHEGYIARLHILKAALPPVISTIGLQIGFLLGGAAVTEMLFVRAGLGQVLLNAVLTKDYPVVQGVVLLGALGYSLATLGADLLIGWIDPRTFAAAEFAEW